MSLILYKVSTSDHLDPESPDLQDEIPIRDKSKSYVAENKKFLPDTKEKIQFSLSTELVQCMHTENRFFSSFMPMYVEKRLQLGTVEDQEAQSELSVTGSFIFEDIESGEVVLSIFRSK